MLEASQDSQERNLISDSDETRYSGTCPLPNRIDDFGETIKTIEIVSEDEDDKPLENSIYWRKNRLSRSSNVSSVPSHATSENQNVEEFMSRVAQMHTVIKLRECMSPDTFLQKVRERQDTGELSEEVFQETRTHRTENSTTPVEDVEFHMPARPSARVEPVSPSVRKHFECFPSKSQNSPMKMYDAGTITNSEINKADYVAFKLNSRIANLRKSDTNNFKSLPASSEDVSDNETIYSIFKKSSVKSGHVPISKYFKVRKKLRNEKKKRKMLQDQLTESHSFNALFHDSSPRFSDNNSSDSIIRLINMSALGPFLVRETHKNADFEKSNLPIKLQKCEDCPCICSNSKRILRQTNPDVKFLSSLAPTLPPALKILNNASDKELHNAKGSSTNSSLIDSFQSTKNFHVAYSTASTTASTFEIAKNSISSIILENNNHSNSIKYSTNFFQQNS